MVTASRPFPLDAPSPVLPDDIVGGNSVRRYNIGMARRATLTIRKTCQRVLPVAGGPVFRAAQRLGPAARVEAD